MPSLHTRAVKWFVLMCYLRAPIMADLCGGGWWHPCPNTHTQKWKLSDNFLWCLCECSALRAWFTKTEQRPLLAPDIAHHLPPLPALSLNVWLAKQIPLINTPIVFTLSIFYCNCPDSKIKKKKKNQNMTFCHKRSGHRNSRGKERNKVPWQQTPGPDTVQRYTTQNCKDDFLHFRWCFSVSRCV